MTFASGSVMVGIMRKPTSRKPTPRRRSPRSSTTTHLDPARIIQGLALLGAFEAIIESRRTSSDVRDMAASVLEVAGRVARGGR